MRPYYYTCDLEETASLGAAAPLASNDLAEVRDRVADGVAAAFGPGAFRPVPYGLIRSYFSESRRPDEFVISLDDRTYVADADAYFDSTRMYAGMDEVGEKGGAYVLTRRDGAALDGQIRAIARQVARSGKRPVVCDDGIFTGDTLRGVVAELAAAGVTPKAVRVILNFSGKADLGGVPIEAYESPSEFVDWIDERDFFYGVKNGGASFRQKGKVYGVPYVATSPIAAKKASVDPSRYPEFRERVLSANEALWKKVSELNGRVVRVLDAPRVGWLGADPETSMASAIASLSYANSL